MTDQTVEVAPLAFLRGRTLNDSFIVLDEAQNIKNSAARQTQAVRALAAPHRVALTGTPVENRLSELWSIMEFLNPGLLGSANYMTAGICKMTNNQPASACTPAIKALESKFAASAT